jgi:hypothetical protein
MLIIAELGTLVWGIYVLVAGKLTVGTNYVVQGVAARLLALLLIAPLPAALTIGIAYGLHIASQGRMMTPDEQMTLTAVEFGILIGCVALVYAIGWPLGGPDVDPNSAYSQYIAHNAYPQQYGQPQYPPTNPYSDNPYQAPQTFSPPPGQHYPPPGSPPQYPRT